LIVNNFTPEFHFDGIYDRISLFNGGPENENIALGGGFPNRGDSGNALVGIGLERSGLQSSNGFRAKGFSDPDDR
jgi:hypothetical protein